MKSSNSISNELYSSIKSRIIEVDFFPGEKISEKTLTDYYDVSRTPIKNALIRLEGEGLVEVISQKGTYVKKISTSKLKEMLTIRCYIETMVVIKETSTNDESIVSELKENLRKQKELLDDEQNLKDKVQKFYVLDNEFHHLVFKLFSKESLWNYIINNSPQLQMYRVLSALREKEYLINKVDEHCKIYNCIADGVATEDIIKYYVEHIFEDDFKDLEVIRNNFPNYFTD